MSEDCRERLARSLGRVMRAMGPRVRAVMDGYSVTWPQFHLMKAACEKDGASVTELSAAMMIAPPTASRMIDSLCEKGLVTKEKDSCDHRIIRVRATRKSEKLLEELSEELNSVISGALEGADPAELESCARQLEMLAENLSGRGTERKG